MSALNAGPAPGGGDHSTSVMFIIYMVIGFTATLACIMVLSLLYFLIRQAPSMLPGAGLSGHASLSVTV